MATKVSEATIQGVLMRYLMDKQHIAVVPNSNQFFHWEADVISVSKSMYVNEFEIKLNIQDYKRDHLKHKHWAIGISYGPARFWYVTHDFDIEPPAKAGWLRISKNLRGVWDIATKKQAPLLHKTKITSEKMSMIARLLSWRIANMYGVLWNENKPFEETEEGIKEEE